MIWRFKIMIAKYQRNGAFLKMKIFKYWPDLNLFIELE